jgi:hypothetical protein|tara:strand:+ start:3393 stop:3611 length:219 start_codon:yes stop_codon:yes gene_type:complete
LKWFNKILIKLETPVEENPIDALIVEKLPGADNEHIQEVYKARWVWYHTILAVEIAFTNILLIAILLVVSFK